MVCWAAYPDELSDVYTFICFRPVVAAHTRCTRLDLHPAVRRDLLTSLLLPTGQAAGSFTANTSSQEPCGAAMGAACSNTRAQETVAAAPLPKPVVDDGVPTPTSAPTALASAGPRTLTILHL